MTDNIDVSPSEESIAVPVKTIERNGIHIPVFAGDVDSAAFDAFGRQRVSDTGQRLDVEFLYDKQPDYFDETVNNGTVTHNAASRDLTLSIANATNGTYATMRSHPVPYTPGNSQLVDITGVLDLTGIGGGTAEVFLRSNVTGSVVDTTVEQSAWDNAISGVDWTDSHILSMDFQSLKVGRIRFALVQNGLAVSIAQIVNDNLRNTGYWQLASLSAYWRLYNDATDTYMEMGYGDESNAIGIRYKITADATATMRAICCTVKSEGGLPLSEMPGLPRCTDNGVTKKTVSTTLIPLISIRVQSTFNSLPNLHIAIPKDFSLETNNPIRLVGIHNGTLTGASWSAVTDSIIEADISASAITGGHGVFAGYFSSAGNNRATSGQGLLGKTVLWNRQSSQTGILTIAAVKTGTSDASCLAALQWDEIR